MSEKLIIPFDGKKESEVDTTGTFLQITFKTLRFLLGKELGVAKNESVTGIIISKDGIKIRIDSK